MPIFPLFTFILLPSSQMDAVTFVGGICMGVTKSKRWSRQCNLTCPKGAGLWMRCHDHHLGFFDTPAWAGVWWWEERDQKTQLTHLIRLQGFNIKYIWCLASRYHIFPLISFISTLSQYLRTDGQTLQVPMEFLTSHWMKSVIIN